MVGRNKEISCSTAFRVVEQMKEAKLPLMGTKFIRATLKMMFMMLVGFAILSIFVLVVGGIAMFLITMPVWVILGILIMIGSFMIGYAVMSDD